MRVNTLLVRWEGGWLERKDLTSIAAVGRIEARLDLGAITSLPEAIRVADSQLAEFARERTQTDVGIFPAGSDVPYVDFSVGDTITIEGVSHRVLGLTVSVDQATGRPIYIPTLNTDVVLGPEERIFQMIRRMADWSLGGRSKVARPPVPISRPLGRAPISSEICETFTKADETWDGSADLAWDITSDPIADGGYYTISSGKLVAASPITPFGGRATAVTPDYGITGPDLWVEFDYVDIGEANAVAGSVTIGLRCPPGWDWYTGGIFFLIETFQGSSSALFPAPCWDYFVYDNAGTPSPITSASNMAGTPVGRWRCELEGDTARVYLDGMLLATGTDGTLSTGGTEIGVSTALAGDVSILTLGPSIDNVCAGDL